MSELITYKVTFKETADEWLFQYRKDDGVIYSFFNLKGRRVLKLLENVQFPGTKNEMENWTKYKHLVTIEMVLNDYSFEAFWKVYNLKVKKEASEKAYEKLNLVEKIKCFNSLKKYDEFLIKTGQAKAHLVTWLNQKRYNDEY
ncbi:hypothetical protein NJT12_20785 [Flavobacterium sp. AC]|uniref:Uncharacterized protein n=1 Tax=Flavobacterium azizsancarii TaxID=2961580 RepID=A0ABT4WHP0_9FLAO|nr:hypothetical protein [Flavobacterium azizsancarii]MDA6072066.1 hypothetical protein [Flavobacterium azizsancarii]